MFKKVGPGVLVAAAFIGPGTVTTCTLAGVKFGYSLLWAILLAIITTIILQEMAARVGLVTQKGLADVIKENLNKAWAKSLAIIIIMSAIVIGNAAYEGGNIGGAVLGMQALFGESGTPFYPWVIFGIAFALLYSGNYKMIEKVLVTLVIIMSVSFVVSAIMTKPNIGNLLQGLFIPSFPEQSTLTIIGLIGTTVVPYNLFLHASLVKEKWSSKEDLKDAKTDTILAITVGGIVSMTILIAAASIMGGSVKNVSDLAKALEPLFGKSATYFIGIGLFAAGITSAITAPLAASYVANSCFGWNANFKDYRFKLVWIGILLIGTLFISSKIKPIQVIQFAQITNGILLPIIATFLVWVVNKKNVMGSYTNKLPQNIVSFFILIIAFGLGIKSILKVLSLI